MTHTSESNKKIFLKDYQAPHFSIDSVELTFEILADKVLVTQTSNYRLNDLKPITLNGIDLKLVSFECNQKSIPLEFLNKNDSEKTLTFSPQEKNFQLKIVTEIDPYNNKSLEGLYKSSQYLVTQCEAQGFRKITYFPDRPDVMTSYLVHIIADQKQFPVLLSNGDLIKKETLPNNKHKVTWKDPWKKPCYLFALFAGDVGGIKDSFTTKSGKKVSLEIYCDYGKESRCLHAMESLKKSMKWDEDVFNREYDLAQYLIVAIDDFNAGAMENKGLNIFNSRLIFADSKTATDTDFFNIESVVAHEYFHNWTGNRITLRDWFQLSLKEGLTVFRDQEFSADMTEKGIQRIRDVDTLKEKQFPEDAGPNSHPVRPQSCYAVDNFFTATIYEKGAEVIRMMRNILGRNQFRKAMASYFEKYDGKAITTDDFRKVILDDSGINSELFKNWYDLPGTPEIKVWEDFNSTTKNYTLKIQQKKETFHIPIFVSFFNQKGNKLTVSSEQIKTNSDGDTFINLTEKDFTLSLPFQEKPVLSFLRNFSAPIKYEWKRSLDDLFVLAKNDDDTFNRRESFSQIYLEIFRDSYEKSKNTSAIEYDKDLLQKFVNLALETIQNQQIPAIVKAKLLSFPSSQILIQTTNTLDPEKIYHIDAFLKQTTADHCFTAISELSQQIRAQLASVKTDQYNFQISAQRELFNNLLELATYSKQQKTAWDLIQNSKMEGNFNQELNNFRFSLGLASGEQQDALIQNFYSKWKNENLVLQKWMAIQADSHLPNTFEIVKNLFKSDKFNMQNPNQVYSLLRTFGLNLFVFFSKEEHWDFFLSAIKTIDSFNPQVAARLASCFQSSTLLPAKQKAVLNGKIASFVKQNKLSNNTFELLSKYA